MTTATRRRVLEETGLLHPRPEAVTAALFDGHEPFFLALDKVQVKYEMLRAHAIGGLSATAAAERHGYSRAAFYLITAAFDQALAKLERCATEDDLAMAARELLGILGDILTCIDVLGKFFGA